MSAHAEKNRTPKRVCPKAQSGGLLGPFLRHPVGLKREKGGSDEAVNESRREVPREGETPTERKRALGRRRGEEPLSAVASVRRRREGGTDINPKRRRRPMCHVQGPEAIENEHFWTPTTAV